MTYILLDAANIFFRARHVVYGDIDLRIGMALHIMLSSINKSWRDFNGSHVVACFEGRSWRKDVYPPYKANRKEDLSEISIEEQEENQLFFDAFNNLQEFLDKKTNVTVLQAQGCEADDFIARWVQVHPDDEHVIISSDTDFYQLLNQKVSQYNGITKEHITVNGVFDDRGNPVLDKNKNHKQIGDPEWLLFEKCIRGDKTDNVFSAYPGARKNGSKNKTGLLEAFEDRHMKGFSWNNFLLQRWVDHNGEEHKVLDDYKRNKMLIDLTMQPDEIKDVLDSVIAESVQAERKKQVGIHFMRFCGEHNLVKAGERADDFARYLGASYA